MKTFIADYTWSGGRGAYEDQWYVIIAETEKDALELALGTGIDSIPKASHWTIREIDNTKAEAHYITQRSS